MNELKQFRITIEDMKNPGSELNATVETDQFVLMTTQNETDEGCEVRGECHARMETLRGFAESLAIKALKARSEMSNKNKEEKQCQ